MIIIFRHTDLRQVLHSNAAGAVMLLLTCWANGELFSASAAIGDQPIIGMLLFIMGSCGCVGLPLYLLLVAEYVRYSFHTCHYYDDSPSSASVFCRGGCFHHCSQGAHTSHASCFDQCTLLRRLLWRCLSYGLGTLLLCITLPLLGCLASACE